jgi:hypothetical protein
MCDLRSHILLVVLSCNVLAIVMCVAIVTFIREYFKHDPYFFLIGLSKNLN